MHRYNPKIDIVFRKLFGSEENKDILLSFVNAVLEGETKLTQLTIKNPYNFPDYVSGKASILDIKAVDEHGVWYDIEMQIAEQGFYGKRALYYWGKLYTNQIDNGEIFAHLTKTIGIHLLDFDYFADKRYVRRVVLKDFSTNQIYKELDYAELYFIEMSKFKKDYRELQTVLDRWITFLNKAYQLDKHNLPQELADEPEITQAIEKLERIYFNEKEQEQYEAERKFRMNQDEEIRTAFEKGEKKGKIEIATNLLKAGVAIEIIATSTGLSKQEVESLINKTATNL